MVVALGSGDDCEGRVTFVVRFLLRLSPWFEMEILILQRPQIVCGDYSMNFHPFGPCNGLLESSNPTLFNHMGISHFNTSYCSRSCSFLSKIFLLILTGSIASRGIVFVLGSTPTLVVSGLPYCPKPNAHVQKSQKNFKIFHNMPTQSFEDDGSDKYLARK